MSLENAACLIGTLYVISLLLKCLKLVLKVLKATFVGGRIDFTRFGEWAVVTGCTDGIGKAYAKQLAAKGLNIICVSRNKEKLDNVASEIEKDYQVKTKIVQVDLSGGHELYEPIAKELEGFEIAVLVNNAAVGVDVLGYYHKLSTEAVWPIINVNVMAVVMLTRLLIPAMVKRKKGIIINVSSSGAVIPSPLFEPYGATKTCLDKFSESLHIEYADKGIIVQSVLPAMVSTKMSGFPPTLFCPTPDDYVRSVLKKVGLTLRCHGYWPHEFQVPLRLSDMQLLGNDHSFATTHIPDVFHEYASVGDCLSPGCSATSRQGIFKVNLNGTSFRLPQAMPSFTFYSYPRCAVKLFNQTMDAYWLRWSAKCGGHCGLCIPNNLQLDVNG